MGKIFTNKMSEDPLYSPFMKKIRDTYYWVPSHKYKAAGYKVKTVRLKNQGADGALDRAVQCKSLTEELLAWWESDGRSHPNLLMQRQMEFVIDKCLTSARKRAKRKGLDFDLSLPEIIDLVAANDGRCAITGIPIDPSPNTSNSYRNPWLPSIDRIKNTRGYTKDNIRVVTVIANHARSDFDDDDFVRMCKAVAKMNPS